VKNGLIANSSMIRMITKAIHFQEQKLEMNITGDELISKTLSLTNNKKIKASIASGYIEAKRSSNQILLTKIIRRI
jgi:hypothetical protein